MKKILITIASVLLVTAVVSAAYAQEAEDGPIVTAQPDAPGFIPTSSAPPPVADSNSAPSAGAPAVGGAPPEPTIHFVFNNGVPANFDISQIENRDFHFNELPEPAQRLFLQGLPTSDRAYFENMRAGSNDQTYRITPSGGQFKDSHPWDGLVQNWRNSSGNWSVSHERRGTGHEPRGIQPPKAYWVTWKHKL